MKRYHVCIMSNRSHTIYVGVTSDLVRRVQEHKQKKADGFTAKYSITRLVFYEEFAAVREAIESEKRIKGWVRAKKIALIEERNKYWRDLSEAWYGSPPLFDAQQSSREGREVLRCAQDDTVGGNDG